LWATVWLWAVAPKKPLFLFYSANLANNPELSLFNPEPELLPIAIVTARFQSACPLFSQFFCLFVDISH
jgi:hypothetical protein